MILWFVLAYLLVSIAIGLYAASRVKNSTDFIMAGRRLPLFMVVATTFATWFASETVLGVSATFLAEGLRGIIADPFGASMCLVLVGLFFARRLYRLNLLTIGDYYRKRYNRTIEVITSLAIVTSYLGWVAAQILALGLVFTVLSQGQIGMTEGMLIGGGVVLVYTLFGGMWSVALTDLFQMIIIIGGLLYIAWIIAGLAGGVTPVVVHAAEAGMFADFWPTLELRDVLAFVGAWVTLMFGSIPQQDVFQRVMSARNEDVAARGAMIGGSLYLLIAFVPIFLAYSATLVDPAMVAQLMTEDSQLILPTLILNHTPVLAQVLFFGALLAAIMSTASATLLAPSVTFSENILRGLFKQELSDRQFLMMTRVVVVCFATAVLLFAMNSESSIFEMVESAYSVTLVTAFVPLVCGLFWKRANNQGALCAVVLGAASWMLFELLNPADGLWPPQLFGLLMSFVGMFAGSLLPSLIAADRAGLASGGEEAESAGV
jgi:solute:Na+ symporter, SSS family